MTEKRSRKGFALRSIQFNMAITVFILVLFSIASVAMLSFRLSYDSAAKKAVETTQQLVDQLNRTMDTYISTMDAISLSILNSQSLAQYLDDKGMNNRQNTDQMEQWFSDIYESRQDIAAIAWFGYDGRVLSSKPGERLNSWVNLSGKRWVKALQGSSGEPVVLGPHVQDLFTGDDYGWVVSQARIVVRDGKAEGILKVDLNFSLIDEMCSRIQLGERGYIFVVDQFGDIVYHPRQQLIYSDLIEENLDMVMNVTGSQWSTRRTIDGTDRWYAVRVSDNTGWRIVGVTYDSELVSNLPEMKQSYLLLGAGVLLLSLILAIFSSRELATPVKNLEESMKEVEQGNFDVRADVNGPTEIVHLGKAFNLMTSTIKDLMTQNTNQQEQKRMSELKALQAQINPHFLYNTLDSIIWMAEGKKTDEVVLMTSSLAKLFRISISKGNEMIAVQSEIEHIRSYLTIQKMRYDDKMDFSIEADSGILQLKMPKILLQPLVENALYHGIKNKENMGHIRIRGYQEGQVLFFEVSDDGVGMTQEQCAQLPEITSGEDSGRGVGVRNVHERIQLHFGSDYGLTYRSEQGKGTTVTIKLPALAIKDMDLHQKGGV